MRQVTVHDVDDQILRSELTHLILYLQGLGHEQCEVLFGWHWGINYYPTARWVAECFPLSELESKVHDVETAGLGRLGGDDLIIKLLGLDCEFCFCHHSGIHLKCAASDSVATYFLERWQADGLPAIDTNIEQ